MAKKPKPSLLDTYHADCLDGIASAWTVEKALKHKYTRITHLPFDHHAKAQSLARIRAALKPGHEISSVDETLPGPFIEELERAGVRVFGYDHHKSAATALAKYRADFNSAAGSGIVIAPSYHSATRLLWDKLLPRRGQSDLVRMIDKMDGDAKGLVTQQDFAAAAYIDAQVDIGNPRAAFPALDQLARKSFKTMAQRGCPILSDQNMRIDRLFATASIIHVQLLPGADPVAVPVVNGNVKYFGRGISHRLTELAQANDSPAAFAWFMQSNGAVSMSIRTDGTLDASDIADCLEQTTMGKGGGSSGAAQLHFGNFAAFKRFLSPAMGKRPKHASIPRHGT